MHKRFKHYWHEAQSNEVKQQELEDIVCDALDELKMHCPKLYWDAMYKMHCAVYGPHFDEHLAKKAVAGMKNVDGTCGEYWTYEQTSQFADQQGIRCKADWYYVMNMLHSDFAEILGSDTNNYVRMAKAYINDPDASEGKVLDVWLAQMEV